VMQPLAARSHARAWPRAATRAGSRRAWSGAYIDTAGIDHDLAGQAFRSRSGSRACLPAGLPAFRADPARGGDEPALYTMTSARGEARSWAEYGFERLIGSSSAPVLHQAAVRNVQTYRQRVHAPPIELHWRRGRMADPGTAPVHLPVQPVCRTVVARIARRLEISPAPSRSRWPPQSAALACVETLTSLERVTANSSFALYRTRPTPPTRRGSAAGRPDLRWW
jgi:hypothetical protein